jgi:phosphatidylglycerol:prolipoprotein diacylglycerol transferase
VFDLVSAYFLMWLVAAAIGIGAGVLLAARCGYPGVRSVIALAIFAAVILAGSKALYAIEGAWFPLDDYVPPRLRSGLHGFRIPGGILALALAGPLACRAIGLPWRQFGDRLIPLAAMALVAIRLGCFLNGCCFGRVSEMPWAVSFPRGGWAHWYHATQRWIPVDAPASLPVHPLQLYFLLAAVAIFAVLVFLGRHSPAPGLLQVVFYLLFFGSTALIEPFRETHLTLNRMLAPAAFGIAATLLLAILSPVRLARRQHRDRRTRGRRWQRDPLSRRWT